MLLGVLFLVLLVNCRQKVEQAPENTLTPVPTPFGITYCDIKPSDLCLDGFGLEDEDKMLILFKADDRTYANIKVLMEQSEGEFDLECLQSKTFLESVYCQGEAVPDGEKIELSIYSASDGVMRAKGAFIVYYGYLPEPDVEFESTPNVTPTATPGSAYPNPATPTSTLEPEYPNPSYPNPSYPN